VGKKHAYSFWTMALIVIWCGDGDECGQTMNRSKVGATLTQQAAMEGLAEYSNLEVEYKNEAGFNADLMQKLADETLEREKNS
jgi:hypothetical protein